MKTLGYILMWLVVIALIVFGAIWLVTAGNKPGELDDFASCIKQSDTKFYGAFWCPHCQAQKALFGKSQEKLPYVECSTQDGQGITPICKAVQIESFPTWTFTEGFTVTSAKEPIVCPVQPGPEGQSKLCGLEPGQVGSTKFKIWKFDNIVVRSDTDPEEMGHKWIFDKNAFANGELSLEFLAEQTGCLLPSDPYDPK